MLMVDEVFLLLTSRRGNPDHSWDSRWMAVAAARLCDLVHLGRLGVTEGADPSAIVLDTSSTGSSVLDEGLARVAAALEREEGGRVPYSVLCRRHHLNPTEEVANALVEDGQLSLKERRLLPDAYPVKDPGPEDALRGRLDAALSGAGQPVAADVVDLVLLRTLGVAYAVLGEDRGGLGRVRLAHRIDEMLAALPEDLPLRRALEAMSAGISTALVPPIS
jgi:hypothetical protein